MEQKKAVTLTKSLLREFYEFGSISNLLDLLDEDAIAFGIKSKFYSIGRTRVQALLQQEYAAIAPCRISKLGCVESLTEEGCTVRVNVIFRTRDRLSNMHQVLVMFRKSEGDIYSICGLHFMRDMRHESTYRAVSSHIMNRGSHSSEMLAEQVKGIVSSYVRSTYVTYRSDPARSLLNYGDEFYHMLDYDSREALDEAAKDGLTGIMHEEDRARVQKEIKLQLMQKDTYQLEYRLQQRCGKFIWCMECGRYILDKAEGQGTFSSIVTNITPLKQTHENFIYTMRHDALTGIYNKNAFYQRTEEILARNMDKNFEIMCIDVARFKVINDLFGEKTGDRLLQYVAHFLQHLTLDNCAYGRLHSDNFVICYEAGNANRQHLINSLQMLAASFALDYRVDFSFGVYRVTERSLSVSAMVDRATLALAQASKNGLVTCSEYEEEMRDGIVSEQVIVNNMNDSLEREEYIVYFQPKYELLTERIVGAEALVRWAHPKLGFIAPDKFIPVFEQNGFIYRLDKYVWEKTCQLIRKHMDEGKPVLPISINVSRIDLYSPTVVQDMVALIEKYDIPPRYLELELTESAYVENPQHIIDITKQLQSMGFPILMDDFGSGYSSLNMLKDMPVDILKIDLKFLSDSKEEERGRGSSILNFVVGMAKGLHIPVIVEGVETRQQVDFLRNIGCECVQGYYFSKPVPLEKYEEMLEENAVSDFPVIRR